MANIFLEANEVFELASNDDTITGVAGGTDALLLQDGVTNTSVGGNIDRIDLAGSSADTTFSYNSTTGQLEILINGAVAVFFRAGLNDPVDVRFSDGNATLTQTGGAAWTLENPADDTDTVTIEDGSDQTGDSVTLGPDESATGEGGGGAGETFTLTDQADSILGTSGDDTITGDQDTYGAADLIADSSTTDNDTLTITSTGNIAVEPIVVGIENINLDFTTFNAFSAAIGGIASGTVTVSQNQAIGSGEATLTNVGDGVTVAAGSNVTSLDITLEADGDSVTIDGGSATTINLAAKTADTAVVTDTATIAAVGTIELDAESAEDKTVEVLTLSGNGAAVTYNMADANDADAIAAQIESLTFSGDQDVTVIMSSAAATESTITDSTTAGTTTLKIDTVGTADLSNATVDLIDVNAAVTGTTTTVQDGQAVKLSTLNAGAWTLDINDNNAATTLTGAISLDLAVNSVENIVLDATADTDNVTSLTVNASTTGVDMTGLKLLAGADVDVTLTGSEDVVLDATATAKSLTATSFTGDLTVIYNNADDIVTVSSGSGNDTFTATTAPATEVTIDGGDGADVFTSLDGSKMVITGGDGSDTLKVAGDMTDISFSEIEVVTSTGNLTGALLSQFNDATYVMTGAHTHTFGTGANLDASTVDLSNLVINDTVGFTIDASGGLSSAVYLASQALTFTGSSVVDTITGTDNGDTISGEAGADIIDGGAGDDTITGGEGADTITGGAGSDSIDLTETTAAIDNVIIGAANAGVDTITGFAAGTGVDTITFADADTTDDTAAGAASLVAVTTALSTAGNTWDISAIAAATDTADVFEITTTLDDDVTLSATSTGADLFEALSSDSGAIASITVGANDTDAYLIAYQNSNAYVWNFGGDAGDATLENDDITLEAVLLGVADGGIAVGDFVTL